MLLLLIKKMKRLRQFLNKICCCEPELDIRSARIPNGKFLRNYISERYQKHCASVITSKFDFVEPWAFSNYCDGMQIFMNQSTEKLNKIAFELLDTNSDGFISEVDLFVNLTLDNDVLFQSIYADYMKVLNFIKSKGKDTDLEKASKRADKINENFKRIK